MPHAEIRPAFLLNHEFHPVSLKGNTIFESEQPIFIRQEHRLRYQACKGNSLSFAECFCRWCSCHYQAYEGNSRSFAACFCEPAALPHHGSCDGWTAPKDVRDGVTKSRRCRLRWHRLIWGSNSSLTWVIVSWTLTGDRVGWMGVGKTGKQNKEDAFQTQRMKFAIEEESWANFRARHSLRWVNKR